MSTFLEARSGDGRFHFKPKNSENTPTILITINDVDDDDVVLGDLADAIHDYCYGNLSDCARIDRTEKTIVFEVMHNANRYTVEVSTENYDVYGDLLEQIALQFVI